MPTPARGDFEPFVLRERRARERRERREDQAEEVIVEYPVCARPQERVGEGRDVALDVVAEPVAERGSNDRAAPELVPNPIDEDLNIIVGILDGRCVFEDRCCKFVDGDRARHARDLHDDLCLAPGEGNVGAIDANAPVGEVDERECRFD